MFGLTCGWYKCTFMNNSQIWLFVEQPYENNLVFNSCRLMNDTSTVIYFNLNRPDIIDNLIGFDASYHKMMIVCSPNDDCLNSSFELLQSLVMLVLKEFKLK